MIESGCIVSCELNICSFVRQKGQLKSLASKRTEMCQTYRLLCFVCYTICSCVAYHVFIFVAGISMWAKVSMFVALPMITICAINAFKLEKAHREHIEHHGRPPFIAYSHLRLRNKVGLYSCLIRCLNFCHFVSAISLERWSTFSFS